ncbi:tungstate ABC transporter substrate-binding protein WtpA [Candidatus Bipolaricaulota bacterium]|nr:tungstate ABC transporter substrate-binding protein WtpA [Candidatus Bipolaricaulota bacterium]
MANLKSLSARIGLPILIVLLLFGFPSSGKTNLKVFHAGSLSIPFKEIEKKFEASHPDVDVQLEAHGSVVAVRQVTEVGKRGDVVAVADYSLIPSMMTPDYADFYLQFAQNRMVLAYTDQSKLSDRVNSDNWYNVLADPDVRYGFSNPNVDPCGYRSPMVMQLAELHYYDSKILDELVIANSTITLSEEGGKYQINTPEGLNPKTSQLSIRNKSVGLVALLQSGGLDYAFEYMSVSKQHGLKFVTLPRSIDLSSTEYANTYKKVSVKTSDGKVKIAKPIVYGITVPSNALHPQLAREFVQLIISKQGRSVFSELGQPLIVPTRGFGEVPSDLEGVEQDNK